jgi:hypothetical protein
MRSGQNLAHLWLSRPVKDEEEPLKKHPANLGEKGGKDEE